MDHLTQLAIPIKLLLLDVDGVLTDGKLYFGNKKEFFIMAAGREPKVLCRVRLGSPVYSTPVVAHGVVYVASQQYLWAVQKLPASHATLGTPAARKSSRSSARSSPLSSREGGREGPPGRPRSSSAAFTGGDSPLVRLPIFPRNATHG